MLTPTPFQVLESNQSLNNGITKQVWFLLDEGTPIRRTLYKESKSGFVIALYETVAGHNSDLYVHTMYYETHKDSSEFAHIKHDSGIYQLCNIHLFDL